MLVNKAALVSDATTCDVSGGQFPSSAGTVFLTPTHGCCMIRSNAVSAKKQTIERSSAGDHAVRVFVSSPGDVVPERRIAEDVIQRLDREFSAYFRVEGIFWEQEPLLATEHFQAEISSPAEADIVVGILWSRLGSPLPPEFPGPLTGKTVTGTEFEWEAALKGWRERRWPAVLFFRKTASGALEVADRRKRRLLNEQLDQVDAFLDRWFITPETGQYKRAFREFKESGEFSSLLYEQLQKLLRKRVDIGEGKQQSARLEWYRGNPYRGLQSFDFEHAPIFFGRTRARNELREALVRRVEHQCGFVTVVGASGSGKSSLVKAGLLPDIAIPGMLEGVGLCRHAILRPSDGQTDPCGALARALLAAQALPELATDGYDEESLGSLLRGMKDPAVLITPMHAALALAAKKGGVAQSAETRLAIVVDQLEELLTKSIADTDRARFVLSLEMLARSGGVMVIATLRSDFLAELYAIPNLALLTAGSGSWVLHAPNEAEIGEMIRLPADAAGVRFEARRETGERLEEVLRRDGAADPASLPLLEYMLAQLWERRTEGGLLTFAAYRALGGLAGVLSRRAEEVFRNLPLAVRSQLPRTLRALVTIAPGENTQATARSAALVSFGLGAQRQLVSALAAPEARLLVTDGGQLRVAHESLLTHWKRAAEQIAADRRDLQARARIEVDCAEWRRADEEKRSSLLLPAGLRLEEAEDLLQRRREILEASTIDYVEQSREKNKAEVARLEWLRLRAETARLRAEAEERFARAQRNELLAAQVESQASWPERDEYLKDLRSSAAQFRRSGAQRWAEAYEQERDLQKHAGASAKDENPPPPKGALLSLEALPVSLGEAMLLHYGERRRPRFLLIDGGVSAAFRTGIEPRLRQLCNLRHGAGKMRIELVIATHPHSDHVGGIAKLLEGLTRQNAPYEVRRLWFNNFVPIGAEHFANQKELRSSDRLVVTARKLGIPLNRPFDYYVMPSEIGPARVALDSGLTITVIGPFQRNIQGLAHFQTSELNRQRSANWAERNLPLSLVEQLGGALSEGFSSPEITLLRNPPDLLEERLARTSEGLSLNEASIVVIVESHGRRILVAGDANGADVLRGLYSAGYALAGERVHVDMMVIPHFGLPSALGPEFFEKVTADHYLVFSNSRFKVPRPQLLSDLHRARGDERYALHVVLGQNSEGIQKELARAAKLEKKPGSAAEIHFHQVADGSLIVNLLAPVDY